ncbi:MAG TPA: CHASE2 domain-containing protein [Caulobacteraceae bacterium]|nr:CHASE2 domain-containing protein [Caulobacteraceae bacterium]
MVSATGLLKALLVSLLLAASAYGVSKLNLFGLENTSDRLADQVYQRITAGDYGADRVGQRAVRVVYLDETSIEAMKGYGWTRFPPTYEQQWTMFDDLMNVGGAPPAAMFVDFVYMGQGGSTDGFDTLVSGVAAATKAQAWADKPGCVADPLMKIACIVAAGGVPIVFAKPSPAEIEVFTDVQRRLDAVTVLAPALVGQQAYPLVTRYTFDATTAAARGVHGFDISPAMAMYAAYCVRRADGCGLAPFRQLARRAKAALAGEPEQAPAVDAVFDAPLDVVWGSRPDPDYLALTKAVTGRAAPCRKAADTWRERLMEQAAGLRGPAAGPMQECPYAVNIGYDRLVSGQGLEAKDLETLLAGKIVLVGGHFRASNDWVESPVHGQVPGVHYHAMALDNLIEHGAEYRRNANRMLDSDLLKSLMIFALAFCGVLGVMTRNSLLDRAVEEGVEPRLRAAVYGPLYLALFAVSIGVVVVATWFGVTYAHRSPINWIGLTSVALGFLFYATRQTLPADISGSIEKIRLVRQIMAAWRRWRMALRFEEDRLVPPKRPTPPNTPPASSPNPPSDAKRAQEAPVHAQA